MTNLDEILKENWEAISDRIINSRKAMRTINKEFGFKNGLIKDYCIERTGYNPYALRVKHNLERIKDMLIRNIPISNVRKYFNISSTALNLVFRQVYGKNAKQYIIEEKAKAMNGYMINSGLARHKDESSGKGDPKFNRYRVKFDKVKKVYDPENRFFRDH